MTLVYSRHTHLFCWLGPLFAEFGFEIKTSSFTQTDFHADKIHQGLWIFIELILNEEKKKIFNLKAEEYKKNAVKCLKLLSPPQTGEDV